MGSARVAITLDERLLRTVDRWIKEGRFASRSQAIASALQARLGQAKRARLARELAKLDPREEQALAEERFAEETWTES